MRTWVSCVTIRHMSAFDSLPKPFYALAPLEGVSDTVFRRIVASCARPDVSFTEFTSADGYCSPGKDRVAAGLRFDPSELPLIAQLWGKHPDTMYETARAVIAMGFTGIDLNMGCPDRAVMKAGCGAALCDTPAVAGEIISAVKQAIKDSGSICSVSVKTRLGNRVRNTEEWTQFLLSQGIDALTVHGRTAKEMSKVPADWDEIGKVVGIRDQMKVKTLIIGNGDVKDVADGNAKCAHYGTDGIMIGRGIFADMWAFDRSKVPHVPTPLELLDVMERHVRLFDEVWGESKHYAILKKFYKIYVNGFTDATDWRVRCMETNSVGDALRVIDELRAYLSKQSP